MTKPDRPTQTLVGWMEALADRTRLRLMRLLEQHELGVVELCEILQLPQSTVSRHLKILSDQTWVHSHRQGTTRLYRMSLDQLDPGAKKLWTLAREQTDAWATIQQDELRLVRRLKNRDTTSQVFFASAAGKWDKLRRELYGDSFTTAAMLALLPRDYVVADLGCGTGQVTMQLAQHVKHVIGVDNSSAMLRAARKRVDELKNVELVRASLDALPMQNATCDAAMLLLGLTYVLEPASVIRESSRILKPQGTLIIVDLLPHDRDDFQRKMGQQHAGFSQDQISLWMHDAKLNAVRFTSLAPEPEASGPALFLATARRD